MATRRALLLALLPLPALGQEMAARDWAELTRQEQGQARRRLRGGQRAAEGPSTEEMARRWDALTPSQRAELLLPPSRRAPDRAARARDRRE